MRAEERAAALANKLSEWLDAGIGPRSYEDILAAIRAAENEALERAAMLANGWHIRKGGYSELAWQIRSLETKGSR